MRYEDDRAVDLRVAYIGGGSRGWAWTFMTDLAMEPSLSGEIRLYDIDRRAAENNAVIGNRLSRRPGVPGQWTYRVCPELGEALEGADFVMISILPGTFDEMESDVHLPERLGVWQSVGDTTGPGGIIRGLRASPMFAGFARAVRRYAPDAWVINYTNPLALCVRTLYHVFPGIKAFGCCHEVFGTQETLRRICELTLGRRNLRREDIAVNVLGLNHFTWFDSASCGGVDLFPVYREFVEKHFAEGFGDDWEATPFSCAHRVKFDLFRRYGLIAAAGDRHLAEFMPGDTYLRDPETARQWKFSLTPVAWRKKELQERLARAARLAAGEEEIPLAPTGEEGIRLIRALCGLERVVSNVNLPNAGQIANLSAGTVVETNALFSRDAVRPVTAGALPENVRRLILPHADNQERVLRAALECDREAVYEAFLTDPLTAGRAEESAVRALADDMIDNTLRYLPAGWMEETL